MPDVTLTLLRKPGCHLCDDARVVIDRVAADLTAEGRPLRVVERSILDDPDLERRFHDDIPVVLLNGEVHGRWRFDADVLRSAVLQVAG
jgi:hypothetical protein